MNHPKRHWAYSLFRIAVAVAIIVGAAAVVIRQPIWRRNPASTASVNPARLKGHVRFPSEDCSPRHALARDNQHKAITYISTQLREAGGRVVMQEYSTPSGSYQNVIAHFGPEQGSRYVVGAHFDACGPQPGADDNASGVAGLLELARLLGKETSLPAHYELVAYNLEEPPFFAGPYMGSAVHARKLKEENEPVTLMLSLEMIGYFSDVGGSQSYPMPLLNLLYPSQANFIAIVGRWDQTNIVGDFKRACVGASNLPLVSIAAPAFVPAIDFSDHRNYWAQGYPALMITDTSFLRNPHYHQPTDTFDTLDYTRMAGVVRMLHAGLLQHAKKRRPN